MPYLLLFLFACAAKYPPAIVPAADKSWSELEAGCAANSWGDCTGLYRDLVQRLPNFPPAAARAKEAHHKANSIAYSVPCTLPFCVDRSRGKPPSVSPWPDVPLTQAWPMADGRRVVAAATEDSLRWRFSDGDAVLVERPQDASTVSGLAVTEVAVWVSDQDNGVRWYDLATGSLKGSLTFPVPCN